MRNNSLNIQTGNRKSLLTTMFTTFYNYFNKNLFHKKKSTLQFVHQQHPIGHKLTESNELFKKYVVQCHWYGYVSLEKILMYILKLELALQHTIKQLAKYRLVTWSHLIYSHYSFSLTSGPQSTICSRQRGYFGRGGVPLPMLKYN